MKKFLIATLISLTSYVSIVPAEAESNSQSTPAEQNNSKNGCIDKKEADSILKNGDYVVLFRGIDPLHRITEVWFNGKRESVSLAYTAPENGDINLIKEVCITGLSESIIFNDEAVDLLKKALDNVKPKT